ncbi:hypothetical protein ACSBR1_025797 [Camellia fascicularis]
MNSSSSLHYLEEISLLNSRTNKKFVYTNFGKPRDNLCLSSLLSAAHILRHVRGKEKYFSRDIEQANNLLNCNGGEDVFSMVEQVSTHPTISQESTTNKGPTSSSSSKNLQSMLGKPTKHINFDGDDAIMLIMMVQSSFLEKQIVALVKVIETLAKSDQE